jgi:hypothetical protein
VNDKFRLGDPGLAGNSLMHTAHSKQFKWPYSRLSDQQPPATKRTTPKTGLRGHRLTVDTWVGLACGCAVVEHISVQRLYSRFAILALVALLASLVINNLILFNILRRFDSRGLHQQVSYSQ